MKTILLRNSIPFLFVIIVVVGFGCLVPDNKSYAEPCYDCINGILYDLKYDLDFWEYYKANYSRDEELGEKVKYPIWSKMVALSVVKPNIDTLKGTPLNQLYRLIVTVKNDDLSIDKPDSDKIYKQCIDYLLSIESEVIKIKAERDKVLSKPFK